MFIAEKGIAGITEVPVDIMSGAHRTPAFLTKNPWARVPVLELDDGRALAETRAICTYLESLHPEPNLMGVNGEERAFIEMADRRVEWSLLAIIANAIRHGHPGLASLEQPQIADFGQSQTQKIPTAAAVFDTLLQQQPWIAGERFTIADITAYCALEFARGLLKFAPADAGLHALQAWRDKVHSRPSAKA
jgi:glutathione S-transferase